MRVALLTFVEAAAPDSAVPRAFLPIGGLSVARHQLGLVLMLGFERIVCIAAGMTPDLIALQHIAEARGVQFNVISGPRALVGMVTATDDVIVLGDGLFASAAEAAELLEQGQAVLVQPLEQGLAAGFERIDLNHTGAAAMRIPGRLVERLAELPSDCDAASALQRIALQAGVRQRPIMPLVDGRSFWSLIRGEADAQVVEAKWIRQRTGDDRPLGPSRAAALAAVRNFGPAMLHAGSGPGVLTLASAAIGLIALGAGWFAHPLIGLGLFSAGWIVRESAVLLTRIDQIDGPRRPGFGSIAFSSPGWLGWGYDLAIIGLAGMATAEPWQPQFDRFFPAFMLVAMLRILPHLTGERWQAWLHDRALLALMLGIAMFTGFGGAAVYAGATVLAMAAVVSAGLAKRITPP